MKTIIHVKVYRATLLHNYHIKPPIYVIVVICGLPLQYAFVIFFIQGFFYFLFRFWFSLSILAKKTHKNCQEYQTAEAVVHGWRVLATNWIQVFWEQLY